MTVNLLVILAMIVFAVAMFWALVHATSCSVRSADSARTMYHNHREEREETTDD